MRKPDIFDEIIQCLKTGASVGADASMSEETLHDLYTRPRRAAAPPPAPAPAPKAPAPKTPVPITPAPKAPAKKPLDIKHEDEGEKKALPPKVAQAIRKDRSAGEPSRLYTALAVISALFLIGAAVITAVDYLNLYQEQHIELPFLSGK